MSPHYRLSGEMRVCGTLPKPIFDDKSLWSFAFVPQGRRVQSPAPLPEDWRALGGECRHGKYPDLGAPTARVPISL